MQVENLLNTVKTGCTIPEQVTVYDSTVKALIMSCVDDMSTAGVPSFMLDGIAGDVTSVDINPRVLTAIIHYVQAHRGPDVSDSDWHLGQYRRILHKLMVEPDEEDA